MANYSDVTEAIAAITAHPICATFVQIPNAYVVYYPDAYTVPGGAMTQRGGNDLGSLNLLYDQIDDFWNAQRLQIPA